MDGEAWIEAGEAAARRHGVLSRADAVAAGVPTSTFYDRAARDGATRVERGVVLPPAARRDFLTAASAVVASVGGRVALTGLSALHLHGVVQDPPRGVQVAVPADRGRPTLRGADDVVRTRTLRTSDLAVVRGLPVVRPAWALLHVGRTESARRVLALYIAALQRGALRHDDVADVLERCGRPPGRGALASAHRTLTADDVDSRLELDVRRLLRAAGLHPHPTVFPFRCPDGRVIHLDVPFPEAWFAIECETPSSHAGARAFELDRRRWAQAQQGGWRLSWVTADRFADDRAGILEEVRAALGATRAVAPPTPTPCRQRRCRVCPPLREG